MASVYKLSYTAAEIDAKLSEISNLAKKDDVPSKISDLSNDAGFVTDDSMQSYAQPKGEYVLKEDANYNKSIIALSVDGTTVTYYQADGSVHSFETQDTDTTYSLGTDETTGLTKLYATTGSAEDGTMTQKAIKTELDKKVGVSIDDARDMLIFTV